MVRVREFVKRMRVTRETCKAILNFMEKILKQRLPIQKAGFLVKLWVV